MRWKRKQKMREIPVWRKKIQSGLRLLGIRAAIWLSVRTARYSPGRIRVWLIITFGLFSLFNGWLVVEGIRQFNRHNKVSIRMPPLEIHADTSMHLTDTRPIGADSVLFREYLDSISLTAGWDSLWRTRPGFRDSINFIKQFYHIK